MTSINRFRFVFVSAGCADDEFRCDNGKCVMREAICPHDDFPYCEDRSNLKLDRCPESKLCTINGPVLSEH